MIIFNLFLRYFMCRSVTCESLERPTCSFPPLTLNSYDKFELLLTFVGWFKLQLMYIYACLGLYCSTPLSSVLLYNL
jgi:hypothetical protein